MSVTQADVEAALKNFVDPNLGVDWFAAKSVKKISVDGDRVSLRIALGYPAGSCRDELAQAAKAAIRAAVGAAEVEIDLVSEIVSHAVQKGLKPMPGVRNIIAVASGKGGVGKSTTAVNLALALAGEGARVGILDADIHGPSQPLMLGVSGRPETEGRKIHPIVAHGLQSMSIGYLIDEDTPMIWRGPMVVGALQQLLNDTLWEDLDYLIVDLPPGTGDIQLSLAQQIPVSGAVIVTTPQDIALLDAQKGLKMFEKVSIPVLGIIENMSVHVCSRCGHAEPIFGEGGGEKMAQKYGTELLGQLPLDRSIREDADGGRPTVIAAPDSEPARMYRSIARKVAARLALKAKDYSGRFPTITVVNN
ncbi:MULTISPECIES: iron-sulfur cluster carrier protein ApbC [Methylococcus]|jgi:ATP-binding protein involved in chromosome partitioning|uniref:Iron-sulfur cluster carrier protein n=2 Tax=Methylococcus capsulatus TaxID=414 RepID=Q60CU7_METCA|nr:iron-sulfur cluster carrier protein ApbC [Methylococcus capsulatus]AAU90813.1 mrP protein [Methylococcus capsulatus str. Bath]QXP86446.1 iron-sulfur cluster carrier protein ApbC [Methylococcus capsulatus]QXP93885.1 iron-sulfur cluster carrier protein ApbC [Methylococcus capsulatus]UQN11391.1 iron-sulfur cluster carrier protein ApbC [Methylococcus capsulatus]CAI8787878.1 P-loop NTPase family protein Mrp [Methylococcus capsulatus]